MHSLVDIFWFRRDLRLNDNAGLFQALRSGLPVQPVFIFDTDILEELENRSDRRVSFIYRALIDIREELKKWGATLDVRYGRPVEVFRELLNDYKTNKVFTNEDYEPYAIKRDAEVSVYLKTRNAELHSFKDQVIFEKNEVVKNDGKPYTVFTPYSRKWKELLTANAVPVFDTSTLFKNLHKQEELKWPSLEEMNFLETSDDFPAVKIDTDLIRNYHLTRDFPGMKGTSRLGIHLRFGTISIREMVSLAGKFNEKFLDELIWREFYQAILWHFPQVVQQSFKPEYDKIRWRNNETEFRAWCEGKTGYPLVDAGMRELNSTGYMHNRVRMVTASFLTKHLLIDWRWGEAYFASKLLDYELASNNGGWQWAAGCGCDAAPYFRIFNPMIQAKKFDPGGKYIRQWIPEFDSLDYPAPIVEHTYARERCLAEYARALKK